MFLHDSLLVCEISGGRTLDLSVASLMTYLSAWTPHPGIPGRVRWLAPPPPTGCSDAAAAP